MNSAPGARSLSGRVMMTAVCSGARQSRPRSRMWRWPGAPRDSHACFSEGRGSWATVWRPREAGGQYQIHGGGCEPWSSHTECFRRNENKDRGDAPARVRLGWEPRPGGGGDARDAPWVPSPPPSPCPWVSCVRCKPPQDWSPSYTGRALGGPARPGHRSLAGSSPTWASCFPRTPLLPRSDPHGRALGTVHAHALAPHAPNPLNSHRCSSASHTQECEIIFIMGGRA